MLAAMAARASNRATFPGPHAASAQCLDLWPELTACRWRGAARRARGGLNGACWARRERWPAAGTSDATTACTGSTARPVCGLHDRFCDGLTMGASVHATASPACCVGLRALRGLRGIASARESYARAGSALSCSMRRCSDSCTRCAPLCARSLARSPPCVPSVHSPLLVSPRPRKGLLTLPAMPLQPYQAINSTGGGAEHEDPCEGAERTMLTMRCRRGARSRGSMRVPDRSVMTGVESALASVTPRTWACSSASAGLPPSPRRRRGEEG